MKFYGQKQLALVLAFMMSISSVFGADFSVRGGAGISRDQGTELATGSDANENPAQNPNEQQEPEDSEELFLAADGEDTDFYGVSDYLSAHTIKIDGSDYNHKDQLNPGKSFELHLEFALSRQDLKDHGLRYKYDLPDHITIGNVGSEDSQRNLYNEKNRVIGTYYILDDVIYITFPGYYDNVNAFFNMNAHWSDVDGQASVPIQWTDGPETILFDVSQITLSKNISKFTQDKNEDNKAEFSVIIRPNKEDLAVSGVTLKDTYNSSEIPLAVDYYEDESGAKKDLKLCIYNGDGSRSSVTYYKYAEVGVKDPATAHSEMQISGIDIPKNGYAELTYGVMVDKKTALKIDARGAEAMGYNTATGTYKIYDEDGNLVTTAESTVRKQAQFAPRAQWLYKTIEDAKKKDDGSAVLVPYTIGINRDRIYCLGGSIVQDEITNYDDNGTVIYDMTETPYVSVFEGEVTTEKNVNLEWVTLDKDLYQEMQSTLYPTSIPESKLESFQKTAMERLLEGDTDELKALRAKLCSKLGVTALTNEIVSTKIFTSEDIKNFLWIVPLDTVPTYYMLHYYTTASLTDMGSDNAAKMLYTEIEGRMGPGSGIGWMNPYKKVLQISKENYGIYEDGKGNYFVDWHIRVTVPKGSYFDHIILNDEVQGVRLYYKGNSPNKVADEEFEGYYSDWFPDAPFISYAEINNPEQSVEKTAQYEWDLSDKLFTITSPQAGDADIDVVVDNLKGVFGTGIHERTAWYATTNEDESQIWAPNGSDAGSSYKGRTYTQADPFMGGPDFLHVYSGSKFAAGQYLGDSDYDGSATRYANHYTWTPAYINYYIKELPRKDFEYNIDINYRTQINPELIRALPSYCEIQEPLTMTNTVRAYQGVKDNSGQYIYNRNKKIAEADASYYISKKDIKASILKSVTTYDRDTKTVSYRVEFNPYGNIAASGTAGETFEFLDKISYAGVNVKADSLRLVDDTGSEPGISGKVIWSNGSATPDASYADSSKYIKFDDTNAGEMAITFDNSTGFFSDANGQFKHMYLVYDVDASNWNDADVLSNAVYLYDEKTRGAGTIKYKNFIGTDTVELVGTEAVSKKMVTDPVFDNNFTADFEVIIDTMAAEAGDLVGIQPGESFTVHDEMSDNLTYDDINGPVSVQIFDDLNKKWVDYNAAGQSKVDAGENGFDVTITVPDDATKYKISYKAIVAPNKYMQVIENKVEIPGHSTVPVTFSKKVYTRANDAGADASTYKIQLIKTDAKDSKIRLGASFKLYYYDKSSSKWVERNNGKSADGLFTTDSATGTLTLSNALCGSDPTPVIADATWYKLEEVKAPAGYALRQKPVYYFVSARAKNPDSRPSEVGARDYITVIVGSAQTSNITIMNDKLSLNLEKVDAVKTDNYLVGAEFGLFSDETCTNRVMTSVEKKKGRLSFDEIEIGSGDKTLYLKETKAPDDYILDETVYVVTIEGGVLKSVKSVDGQKELTPDAEIGAYVITNSSDRGSLVITKTVTANSSKTAAAHSDEEFAFSVTLTDPAGNVYTDGGKERAFDAIKTHQDGTKENVTYMSGDVFYLKTKETFKIINLPEGLQYKVTEVENAEYLAGFEVTSSLQTGTVNAGEAAFVSGDILKEEEETVAFTNALKAELTVTKETANASDPTKTVSMPDGLTLTVTSDDGKDTEYVKAVWSSADGKFVAAKTYKGVTFDDTVANGFKLSNVPASGKVRIYETGEEISGYTCELSSPDGSKSGEYVLSRTALVSGEASSLKLVNTYTTSVDVPLQVSKKLTGRSLQNEEFTFALYDTKGTTRKTDDIIIERAKNGADGSVTFGSLKFTTAGSHDYYIKEVVPTGARRGSGGIYTYKGVTYDNAVIDVHIDVDYDSADQLTADVQYSKGGTVLTDPADRYFENTYATSGSITIAGTKKLQGRTLTDDEFTFLADISRKDAAGTEEVLATGMQVGTSKRNGKITFDFTDSATGRNYLKFTGADDGFTYTYDIYEKKPAEGDADYEANITYSDKHYIVIAEVKDDFDGTLDVTKKITCDGAECETISFTNYYGIEGEFVLRATKALLNRKLEDGQFSFEIIEGTKVVSTGTCDAAGNVIFTPIHYYMKADENGTQSTLGTHRYTVREVIPADVPAGYTYDTQTTALTVTVRDEGTGKLRYTVSGAAVDKSAASVDAAGVETVVYDLRKSSSTRAANFVNTYSASGTVDISVSKTLAGRKLQDGEFAFWFTEETFDTATGGLISGSADPQYFGSAAADGTIVNSRFPMKLTEADAGHTKVIRIGEYTPDMQGSAVPGIEYGSEVYTIELVIEDKGDGTLDIKKTVTDKDGNAVNDLVFTNKYKAESTVTFKADKILKGSDIAAGQFAFDIYEGDKVVATGTNEADGSITFSDLRFFIDGDDNNIGKHEYKVKERIPDPVPSGYKYDETVYDVTVTAADKGDGTLDIAVTGAALSAGGISYDVTKAADAEAVFVNNYEAKGTLALEALKTLRGRSIVDGEFGFTAVEYRTVGGSESATGRTFKGTAAADGKITFDTINYERNASVDDRGIYRYVVSEDIPAGDLKGVTYGGETYTVDVMVSDAGDGTLSVLSGIADKDGAPVSEMVFKNEYQAEAVFTLKADKKLLGTALEKDQFAFEMLEGDKVVATGTNDADGSITFSDVKFFVNGDDSYMGEHEYTVKEIIPAAVPGGYTYDDTVFGVKVTAADNGDGTVSLDVKYTDDAKPAFVNSYEASGMLSLEAKKILQGRDIIDGEFSFEAVEFAVKGGTETATGRTFKGTADETGKVVFEEITYVKNKTVDNTGSYVYKVSEVDEKLPGVTYDDSVFTVETEVKDEGTGVLSVTSAIKDAEGKDVEKMAFTNSYKAEKTFKLRADKALEGGELKAGEFRFEITEGGKVVAQGTNDADGKIVFDEIRFFVDGEESYIGQHDYIVREVVPDKPEEGITYDTTTYELSVIAVDNGAGDIVFTVSNAQVDAKSGDMVLLHPSDKKAAFVNKKTPTTTTITTTTTTTNTTTTTQKRTPTGVATGDSIHIALLIILMIMSLGVIGVILKKKRR